MKKNSLLLLLPAFYCIFLGCSTSIKTISPEPATKPVAPGELFETIAHMDSVLFNAFNRRDTASLKKLFAADLEFYHDITGLTGYEWNMRSFKNLAAEKNDLKRELVPGSLEVYPVKDYGAIQVGMHRFCHTENGKQDCGTFKFVHIWKKIDNEWKITRVISYGH